MTRVPRGAARLKWRRQRQEKARRWPTLNLVALMDVFTILVFYFLVHSADDTPQAHSEWVRLPESIASEPPRDTPVVIITRDKILLEGELLVAVDAAMGSSSDTIKTLGRALQTHSAQTETAGAEKSVQAGTARELTIMGDESVPFELLNKVMRTCTRAGYGNIALSVLQRPAGVG